ncbi:unnamed protein product [Schistosoma curassoni]|uniref:Uncharacterized protein n=1 Tax=Schistosoma curassoni TaxID=6186 RepID=A0A183L031_9TREM|nr:unnamed protein product [Schistosoma curassoni]
MSDHRVVLSIIHSLNAIQLNSKASVMCQSRHFDQQTWKRTETLIRRLPWETYFTTDSVEIALVNLYRNLMYCLDCTAPVIGHVVYNANKGQNTFKTFKRRPRKLKRRYYEHNEMYELQSTLNLINRNASSKRQHFMNIENKALGSRNPELSVDTNKFFIVNESIFDDPIYYLRKIQQALLAVLQNWN